MKIFVPGEAAASETRVAVIPETVGRLVSLGATLAVATGLGKTIRVSDEDYRGAGASVQGDCAAGLAEADLVLRLGAPAVADVSGLKRGALHVSFLDPFNRPDLVRALASAGVAAMAMEMIPRTTLAQKMDALSSQASLAGYVAVLMAAERLDRIFPMMMTPAGTITPARVFIIGAGVAGLQAIATAKRLGARVEAYDTRPVVAEQVQSLGARFVSIDVGETGQTKDGYARELTDEQIQRQRDEMARHCANADVVVTTAQVFGRKAPLIVTAEMVRGMRPGSILVDLAVETGGNVAGAKPGEEVDTNGVLILGHTNLPGRVPVHASQVYSSNLYNLVSHFWDKEAATFKLDRDDEIIQGCLVTHGGAVVSERLKEVYGS